MTTENTGQKNEHEEKRSPMGGCSSQKFAEMMAKCGEDMKCEFGGMMREMMKGGCCQSEEK